MGIWNWLVNFSTETVTFSSIMGILLYWVPVAICLIGYSLETLTGIRQDIKNREAYINDDVIYYIPEVTIGTIIGKTIVSFFPVANLATSIVYFGWDWVCKFFSFLGDFLDFPLVPEPKKMNKSKLKNQTSKIGQ